MTAKLLFELAHLMSREAERARTLADARYFANASDELLERALVAEGLVEPRNVLHPGAE